MKNTFEKYTAVEVYKQCNFGFEWFLAKKVENAGQGLVDAKSLIRKAVRAGIQHGESFHEISKVRVKKYGYKKNKVTFEYNIENRVTNRIFDNILGNGTTKERWLRAELV